MKSKTEHVEHKCEFKFSNCGGLMEKKLCYVASNPNITWTSRIYSIQGGSRVVCPNFDALP